MGYRKQYLKFTVMPEDSPECVFGLRYDMTTGELRIGGRCRSEPYMEAWLLQHRINITLERTKWHRVIGEATVGYATFIAAQSITEHCMQVSRFGRLFG